MCTEAFWTSHLLWYFKGCHLISDTQTVHLQINFASVNWYLFQQTWHIMLLLSEKNILLKPFKNNIKESPNEQQQKIFNTFQIFDYESFYVAGKTIAQSREGSDCCYHLWRCWKKPDSISQQYLGEWIGKWIISLLFSGQVGRQFLV